MMIPEITIFISECSMGYVECSFDNLAWFFRQMAVILLVKLHKTSKIQKFLQDCPMTKRKHFRQPRGKRFEKSTNVFWTVTELLKFLERFQGKIKKYFLILFPWTLRMQFWHSCRKVFAKGLKTVPPMSIRKEGKFQKTKKYSKSSLQTPKMLFWQPYLKRFNKKPKFFQKCSFEKIEDS